MYQGVKYQELQMRWRSLMHRVQSHIRTMKRSLQRSLWSYQWSTEQSQNITILRYNLVVGWSRRSPSSQCSRNAWMLQDKWHHRSHHSHPVEVTEYKLAWIDPTSPLSSTFASLLGSPQVLLPSEAPLNHPVFRSWRLSSWIAQLHQLGRIVAARKHHL